MFWLRFLRLLASIAWEGAYNLVCLLVFVLPWRRRLARDRVRTLMSRTTMQRLWILSSTLVLASAVWLGVGCHHPGQSGSFQRQIDDFAWSVEVLAEDKDPPMREIAHDLTVTFDPEWGQLAETFQLLGW